MQRARSFASSHMLTTNKRWKTRYGWEQAWSTYRNSRKVSGRAWTNMKERHLQSSCRTSTVPCCPQTHGILYSSSDVLQTRSSSASTLLLRQAYRYRTLEPSLQPLAKEERCVTASSSTAVDKREALTRKKMMTGGWTCT